jgi:hypothetical protein
MANSRLTKSMHFLKKPQKMEDYQF